MVIYCVGLVTFFASGRLALPRAGLFLALPFVLGVAVLRPEWTVLIVVALPPAVTPPGQATTLIMVAAMFGFLLQGRVRLGPATGVYPLLAIIALAIVHKFDAPSEATTAADAALQILSNYALLMLVAFHAAANGRVRIDTVINAILVGIVATAVSQPWLSKIESFGTVAQTPFHGPFTYLAVIGFGVTYVRISLGRSAGRGRSLLDAFLMLAFLFFTAISYNRTAWIAALSIFVLVSIWTAKKSFWIVSSLLLVLALTVPVVGERILPQGSAGISEPERLARVTSGRSELWLELWKRGVDAPLLGPGWGYVWSLGSRDLFGVEGEFGTGPDDYIYPHNDFLYLFVELGIVGLGLLVAFWLNLLRKTRLLSRSRNESTRYGVRVLVPVIITMFFVQLFANGFANPSVADRFFIVAGLVFGLHYVVRQRERPGVIDSSSVRASQRVDVLGG
jgi:O-antigen ligase